MAVVRKRKLKLKKKNFTIFILSLLLIIGSISYGINLLVNSFTKTKDTAQVAKTNITKKELKLKKLKNINKKINYFNEDYLDRYLAYQKDHKDLNIKQIIIDVNIGIDQPYYTNTKEATNLNKLYLLVNKYHYLKSDFIPSDLENISLDYARSGMKLVKEAKDSFESLAQDAKKEDLTIIAMSSYRSYQYQDNLYKRYQKEDGKTTADTYSGRPGYSEHQTGLAVDVYNGKVDYTNFENTKEFDWMEENAHKYGFILRFPKEKTDQTGYEYESWHYRYVGKDIATYIKKNKLCLEEYYVTNIEYKKEKG